MAPRLSGQTSIFSRVFFVSKSLLKFAILTQKSLSHVRILIYRMKPLETSIVIALFANDLFHSLFQALGRWGRSKKRAGDKRDQLPRSSPGRIFSRPHWQRAWNRLSIPLQYIHLDTVAGSWQVNYTAAEWRLKSFFNNFCFLFPSHFMFRSASEPC